MRPIDTMVIIVYLIATTCFGLYFTRRQKTTKDYFLGGKNLPWWAILLSIIAQETSAVTILSVPAIAFNPHGGNFTFLQIPLGYFIGRTLIAFIFVPRLYRGEYFSIYGYLTERFGAATKNLAVLSFLVSRFLSIGIRIFTGSILTKVVTGWPAEVSIVVTTLFTIFYMCLGGFTAVVWIDVLQFTVYMFSSIVSMFVIFSYLPNWHQIIQVAYDAGKFKMFNFAFDPKITYGFWAGLIGGAFLTMGTHGTDQSIAQRLLAAHSEKDAKKIIIGSGIAIFFQFTFFLFLGVMLFAFFHQIAPQMIGTFAKNEEVFPRFALHWLPLGLGGLAVAGIFAAAMSSSDFNPLANSIINDIYKPYFKPNAPDKHYVFMGKVFTVVCGLTIMSAALIFTKSDDSLLDLALKIPSYTYGPLLGVFLMGFLFKKTHQLGVIVGALVGFLVLFLIVPPWPAKWGMDMGLFPKLAWPWFSPIACIATMITGILVSALVPRKTLQAK